MQLDSKLTLGQRVEVRFGSEWLATRLEDHDGGARLVIGWPTDRARRLIPLKVGDTVRLAVSTPQDALYSAPARVERVIQQGVAMLDVRVVGDWERSQRRGAVRVAVAIRPRVAVRVLADKRQPLRAGISNLSANGVQLRSQDELKPGDLLELAFSVMDIPEEIEIEARVRRVQQLEQGSLHVWEAGCEFEALPARLNQKLVQFIFAQQRAQARNRRAA